MNSKELTELIHQNTRIILPEFGAFLVKDSGEKGFNPANVSFSPFLRYNDGMLEVYVAKKRGISKEEASKDVHEFVETIKNELLEKGSYEIEELGLLMRDQRGSLSFSLAQSDEKKIQKEKVSSDKRFTEKETSIETIKISEDIDDSKDVWVEDYKPEESADPKDKKIRKIIGTKAKVEKIAVTKKVIKTNKKIDELEQEPVQDNIHESIIESKPEPTQEAITIIQQLPNNQPNESFLTKSKDEPVKIETKIDQKAENEKPNPTENGTKKKKGFKSIIYTGIAIVLVVFVIIGIRNYYFPPIVDEDLTSVKALKNTISDNIESKDKIEKPKDDIDKAYNESINEDKKTKERLKKEDEQEEAIKNTLIKNTQIKNTLVKNSKIKNAENKTNTGIKFHIIAGSFKNPDLAKKFLNELNTSGYKASILIQPSGMNAVTIGSYSNREEANEAMKTYKNKLPNLWILKK